VSGCTARPGDKVDMKAEERRADGFDYSIFNKHETCWVGSWRPTHSSTPI